MEHMGLTGPPFPGILQNSQSTPNKTIKSSYFPDTQFALRPPILPYLSITVYKE